MADVPCARRSRPLLQEVRQTHRPPTVRERRATTVAPDAPLETPRAPTRAIRNQADRRGSSLATIATMAAVRCELDTPAHAAEERTCDDDD